MAHRDESGRPTEEPTYRAVPPIEPMKKVTHTLRNHRELIANWFRAKGAISAGTIEGFNYKVKLTTRKSYGFRTYDAIEISLYHNLGRLPEPDFTHRFW
jgi:transposase